MSGTPRGPVRLRLPVRASGEGAKIARQRQVDLPHRRGIHRGGIEGAPGRASGASGSETTAALAGIIDTDAATVSRFPGRPSIASRPPGRAESSRELAADRDRGPEPGRMGDAEVRHDSPRARERIIAILQPVVDSGADAERAPIAGIERESGRVGHPIDSRPGSPGVQRVGHRRALLAVPQFPVPLDGGIPGDEVAGALVADAGAQPATQPFARPGRSRDGEGHPVGAAGEPFALFRDVVARSEAVAVHLPARRPVAAGRAATASSRVPRQSARPTRAREARPRRGSASLAVQRPEERPEGSRATAGPEPDPGRPRGPSSSLRETKMAGGRIGSSSRRTSDRSPEPSGSAPRSVVRCRPPGGLGRSRICSDPSGERVHLGHRDLEAALHRRHHVSAGEGG